jgi:hypothetical protein
VSRPSFVLAFLHVVAETLTSLVTTFPGRLHGQLEVGMMNIALCMLETLEYPMAIDQSDCWKIYKHIKEVPYHT